MFNAVRLSHWLSVVANTVLGCLHPVKITCFTSVPEEHAASISRASNCKVEMANLPLRCKQHNHYYMVSGEKDTHTHTACTQVGLRHAHLPDMAHTRVHTHTHTDGFETYTLARYGTHACAHTHTHGWV